MSPDYIPAKTKSQLRHGMLGHFTNVGEVRCQIGNGKAKYKHSGVSETRWINNRAFTNDNHRIIYTGEES